MNQEKIDYLNEKLDVDIDLKTKEVIREVVIDCSKIIRKNPLYTSLYQNPDTMADQLLNAYGVKDK